MLPFDLNLLHILAMLILVSAWFMYSFMLKQMGYKTLNSQLNIVRHQWIQSITERSNSPFDAMLLGHIVNPVAFFGSATLIVLAGVFSIFGNIENTYSTLTRLHFINNTSLELFSINYALLAFVLTVCFFAFTYSLRKMIYAIALIGALPQASLKREGHEGLVEQVTIVITASLKTFNFGIRGFYYAVAALVLFISPLACIAVTVFVTVMLLHRQCKSETSQAILKYVETTKQHKQNLDEENI